MRPLFRLIAEVPRARRSALAALLSCAALGIVGGPGAALAHADGSYPQPTTPVPPTTGDRPAITVTPSALSIGYQAPGTEGTGAVSVENTGRAPLTITGAEVTGSSALRVSAIGQSPVPPGESTYVQVAFAPTAAVVSSGMLRIASDAPGAPTLIPISADAATPSVTAPSTLEFGRVDPGSVTSRTVELVNHSAHETSLDRETFTPAGGFGSVGFLSARIRAGETLRRTVQFWAPPGVSGRVTSVLELALANGQRFAIPVSATVAAPPSALKGDALVDFGDVVRETAATRFLSVTNTSTRTVSVTALNGSGFISLDRDLPLPVAAGQTLKIPLTFNRDRYRLLLGPSPGQLSLATDSGDQLFFETRATVVAGPPTQALNFGTAWFGADLRAFAEVSFGNPTATTATGFAAAFAGVGASQYSLVTDLPASLAPGAATVVTVAFAPSRRGPAPATLTIRSSATTQTVALRGTGKSPIASLSATVVGFGTVATGTRAVKTVKVTNTGDGWLPFKEQPMITGDEAAGWTVSGDTAPLRPGASSTFTVTFAPSAPGVHTGTLRFSRTAPPVSLTGTGG